MTLFKQIAALVSLLIILLLMVTTWNNLQNSSKALEGQLQTMAQNMATTLGLAIANSGQGTDPAYIETMFNVIFDSGYLAKIELVSPDGEVLEAKEQTVAIRDVPAWLMTLAPIEAASGESVIMKNWRPYGTLRLTLHSGYAYAGLYKNLKSSLAWFATLAAAGLLILWWMLRLILNPLQTISKQADAICEKRFVHNDHLPKTRELNTVALAMNHMVETVHNMFAEQAESLNRYHRMLYRDALTGLGNRRHLMVELEEIFENESVTRGSLSVIFLHGLVEIKKRKGYKETDKLILALAQAMETVAGKKARKHCMRINDDEFALYCEGDINLARMRIQSIFDTYKDLARASAIDDISWLYAGLTEIHSRTDSNAVLSQTDFALAQAKSSGEYTIYHESSSDLSLPQGKMQWCSLLEDSLEQRRFFLVAQPTRDNEGNLVHQEVYIRLRNTNTETISAGIFMPVANTLEMDFDIEGEVFRMALEIDAKRRTSPLAVNISPAFFSDAKALASLESFVRESNKLDGFSVLIETGHFILSQNQESAETIISLIRQHNCQFGIDNFDLSLPLDLLQTLRPDYIKMNARTLANMLDDTDLTGLQALRSLTQGLDITIIAVGIDSQEMLDKMIAAGIHTFQGYHIGKPEELS